MYPFLNVPWPEFTQKDAGKIGACNGIHSYNILTKCAEGLHKRQFQGVVTAPVNKTAITHSLEKTQKKQVFTGHTEFFAIREKIRDCSMCFLSDLFNLILLTTHVPIKSLSSCITPHNIDRAVLHAQVLKNKFHDSRSILLLGFNPHAGENGFLGKEDLILKKRAEVARKNGIDITDPLPADTAFKKILQGTHRTVISCYHDQGLIPLKMYAKTGSVNVTLGLPYVRTSADHGTAYDIAGKNKADWRSMHKAITAAETLLRQEAAESTADRRSDKPLTLLRQEAANKHAAKKKKLSNAGYSI